MKWIIKLVLVPQLLFILPLRYVSHSATAIPYRICFAWIVRTRRRRRDSWNLGLGTRGYRAEGRESSVLLTVGEFLYHLVHPVSLAGGGMACSSSAGLEGGKEVEAVWSDGLIEGDWGEKMRHSITCILPAVYAVLSTCDEFMFFHCLKDLQILQSLRILEVR